MALWMLGLLLPLIVAASRPQWLRSNAPPPPPDYEQEPEWMNDMPMPPSVPPYCIELENRDPCTPLAYVRAQDLRPMSIARGEVRVLVPKGCKESLDQVHLRLSLEEYEHTKLPDARMKMPWDYLRSQGPPATYETTTHTVWTAQGELETGVKGTNEIVRPFSIAVPNINYPAATTRAAYSEHDNDSYASLQTWAVYRYVAVVSLSNGKTYEVTAGFTSFQQVEATGDEAFPDTTSATARVRKTSTPDDPTELPSWLPIPSRKKKPGLSADASAELEVHFPNGASVVDGGPLAMRVRLIKHEHIDEHISPHEKSVFMGVHLSSSFIPAKAGFQHSPMIPIMRASVSPTSFFSNTPPTGSFALVTLPLSGDWIDVPNLKMHENAAPNFAQTFGRVEGTVMLGLQPAMWRDADDGWSIRACNLDPSGRGLEAYVPIRVVPRRGANSSTSEPPAHYLASTSAPVLLPGWRESYDADFPAAEARTAKKTQVEARPYEGVPEPWDEWDLRRRQRECNPLGVLPDGEDDYPGPELELVERTFAGMLWARRYGLGNGGA